MRLRQHHDGFTLIEMLLVVAMIALLISLLLPSLTKSREAAKRTICANNLHQIGSGLFSYGSEALGRIPIGFIDNARGSNYHMIWSHTTPQRHMMLGMLVVSRHVTSGQIFYCPSQTGQAVMHDTADNRWNVPYSSASLKKPTRSGYSARPLHNGKEWNWGSHTAPSLPVNMARVQTLGSVTVATDITSHRTWVDSSHIEGLNAAHADGAVKWVQRDRFDAYLDVTLYTPSATANALWTAIDGQ